MVVGQAQRGFALGAGGAQHDVDGAAAGAGELGRGGPHHFNALDHFGRHLVQRQLRLAAADALAIDQQLRGARVHAAHADDDVAVGRGRDLHAGQLGQQIGHRKPAYGFDVLAVHHEQRAGRVEAVCYRTPGRHRHGVQRVRGLVTGVGFCVGHLGICQATAQQADHSGQRQRSEGPTHGKWKRRLQHSSRGVRW